jgi:hypothetical protein
MPLAANHNFAKERVMARFIIPAAIVLCVSGPFTTFADDLMFRELKPQGSNNTQAPAYQTSLKLGDTLRLSATGNLAARIQEEIAKGDVRKVLSLHVRDVRIPNLPIAVYSNGKGSGYYLNIDLQRNAADDDNRKAWEAFFAKDQEFHYGGAFDVNVALSVGTDLPISLRDPVKFSITNSNSLWWTILPLAAAVIGGMIWLAKGTTALRDGATGPYSLGKSQMAVWGLIVAACFAGVWILTWRMERIPPQVLILLGISGSTALASLLIGSTKKSKLMDQLQQSQVEVISLNAQHAREVAAAANGTAPPLPPPQLALAQSQVAAIQAQLSPMSTGSFWLDICSNGDGISFHRLQVVIWTLILATIFVWSVCHEISMPEFSETLLYLMGISNGTYLGFKYPEKDG